MNSTLRSFDAPPDRRGVRVHTLPPPARGQFGPDHQVVEVIRPQQWQEADPFILLMDDRLDGHLVAGPHPHAGFETVTFIVDGQVPSEHRGGEALAAGDVEWTTAGSGIVHGPETAIDGKLRVLQLWLTLPQAQRWTAPDHQVIRRADALETRHAGVVTRLYSGSDGQQHAPTRNRVPVTLMDIALEPGAAFAHPVPAAHNGFLYVLDGEARIGDSALAPGDVGWLERAAADAPLHIANRGSAPARVLLYTGERQNIPITWHGPFIGDSRADITRSFERYRAGHFQRV